MAATGRGQGPLRDVLLAQSINRTLGGAFVASWDVPHLDEATMDLFMALNQRAVQTPNMPENVRAVEDFKRRYRNQIVKH